MTNLQNYMNDGANYQAQAVLAFLRLYLSDLDSLIIEVARWENCREQGYVMMIKLDGKQLNIAFFEHRNSDNICALKWEQSTINSPTIDTAKFGDVYKDKWDVSYKVSVNEISKMSDWIVDEVNAFAKSLKVQP